MAYGDKKPLKKAYPMMKDWVEWIKEGHEQSGWSKILV
jgi:hypothetical protein